ILDIGNWGSAIFQGASDRDKASVAAVCFVIEPWNAKQVEAALRARGLTPEPDNGSGGFESFHVKDPNGFDLQISNGNGLAKARKTRPAALSASAKDFASSFAAPLAATGWNTVWLDHFSYNAANYKEAASFYMNLLGWKETYDEGSQHELMIGEIG